jgi:predicted ArsR family transcriptional regulator
MTFQSLPTMRRAILLLLKQDGPSELSVLAARLKVTKEAIRQQLVALDKDGWVQRETVRRAKARSGRPMARYSLSPAGDHVFPKAYDALAVEILQTISGKLGPEALRKVLSGFAEARVQKWAPLLAGKSLPEKLKALKDLYQAKDPFTRVEESKDGLRLVEGNCPFLSVASQQPALCSVTVSVLSRLLGVEVVREERSQAGHGRCVFKVNADKPLAPGKTSFRWEPAPASK